MATRRAHFRKQTHVKLCSLSVAVLAAALLTTASRDAAGDAVCGNGVVEGAEECDDGGICIGGANAGTRCTKESDCVGNGVCVGGTNRDAACASDAACPGGACVHCKTFGGDGCAANCTLETDVPFDLVPGEQNGIDLMPFTSGFVIHGDIFTIPLALTGRLILTIGKQYDGAIPLVVKADSRHCLFPHITALTAACACVRCAAAKTCGGTFLDADGTPAPDCSLDESVCAGKSPCAFLHGPGNAATGTVDCTGLDGIDFTIAQEGSGNATMDPARVVTFSGRGVPGSARGLVTVAMEIVPTFCSGTYVSIYGPDGELCTADDPPSTASMLVTAPFVTGTATAEVVAPPICDSCFDIGPVSVTGSPFSCGALERGDATRACLATANTALSQRMLGDIAYTGLLCALPPCEGDCNGDRRVTVDELITLVNIALGNAPISACPGGIASCPPGEHCLDPGSVDIANVLGAVRNALEGCPTP